MMPSDADLTRRGLQATGRGRVLVLACGALAREILAILRANRLDHVDLHCLPAILHNAPDRIPEAVEQEIAARGRRYDRIMVAYADCGTGGRLAKTCDRLGVTMIDGPHCYSFFDGNAAFSERDEVTAFYLTDFLARQFDAFVWQPLGLDRHPELRDIYFGNYEKLVYLSQVDDPTLLETARHCAKRLNLAFEHRHTGFGDLEPAIARL